MFVKLFRLGVDFVLPSSQEEQEQEAPHKNLSKGVYWCPPPQKNKKK